MSTALRPPLVEENPLDVEETNAFFKYNCYSNEGSVFRPSCRTIENLPPGYYYADQDGSGLILLRKELNVKDLIKFPNSISEIIIKEFADFWDKKSLFISRNESHKRGILLWGPPGGGKTCTVSILINDFIKTGNIVIEYDCIVENALQIIKKIEPDRKIMVVIEDIDLVISRSVAAERSLLSFLDGEIKYNNLIVVATTNFPEKLDDRINRPSRFDRIAYIGMPTELERLLYLKEKCLITDEANINQWVKDTDNWSFAYLKELVVSVEILGLSYNETIDRLKGMQTKKADSKKYKQLMKTSKVGF